VTGVVFPPQAARRRKKLLNNPSKRIPAADKKTLFSLKKAEGEVRGDVADLLAGREKKTLPDLKRGGSGIRKGFSPALQIGGMGRLSVGNLQQPGAFP